jgi:hypothetical protein
MKKTVTTHTLSNHSGNNPLLTTLTTHQDGNANAKGPQVLNLHLRHIMPPYKGALLVLITIPYLIIFLTFWLPHMNKPLPLSPRRRMQHEGALLPTQPWLHPPICQTSQLRCMSEYSAPVQFHHSIPQQINLAQLHYQAIEHNTYPSHLQICILHKRLRQIDGSIYTLVNPTTLTASQPQNMSLEFKTFSAFLWETPRIPQHIPHCFQPLTQLLIPSHKDKSYKIQRPPNLPRHRYQIAGLQKMSV